MSDRSNDSDEPKMVLGHDPVPGYKPVFFIAITFGALYLAYILWKTL